MCNCISSVSFSIFVMRSIWVRFWTQRGLRQGDLLIPFLFDLSGGCSYRLVLLRPEKGVIEGLKLVQELVRLTHI